MPLGAFGMTAFVLDLYFARPGAAPVHGLDVAGFLHAAGQLARSLLDLTADRRVRAASSWCRCSRWCRAARRRRELSRVIAGNNILNALFIVAAAVCGIVLQQLLGWSDPAVLPGARRSLNALVAIYIFTLVPEFLMRFLSLDAGARAVPGAHATASRTTCPTKARRCWCATTSATWTR